MRQIESTFTFVLSHLTEEFTAFTLAYRLQSSIFSINAIKAHYQSSNIYANGPGDRRKSDKLLDLKQEIAFK